MHQPISEFKKSFWRIIRNPVILSSCGSNIFTILGVYGYLIWLPKYFEHEFRVSKSRAAFFSGNSCVHIQQHIHSDQVDIIQGLSGNLSMIFGVLLSGYLMSRYRPKSGVVSLFIALTKYIYALGLLVVMLINCGFENDLPGILTADGRYNSTGAHLKGNN